MGTRRSARSGDPAWAVCGVKRLGERRAEQTAPSAQTGSLPPRPAVTDHVGDHTPIHVCEHTPASDGSIHSWHSGSCFGDVAEPVTEKAGEVWFLAHDNGITFGLAMGSGPPSRRWFAGRRNFLKNSHLQPMAAPRVAPEKLPTANRRPRTVMLNR